jgi:hypothetical protein
VGRLTYDSTIDINIPDRLLTHLQIVIGSELRQGHSFYFTWRNDAAVGGGHSTLWIHPAIALHFKYERAAVPEVNRAWLQDLLRAANAPDGLRIVPEPGARPNDR